jgi:hypothetical protein
MLKPLPLVPYRTVLKLERFSHEGMVSVSGNLYSVPTRHVAGIARFTAV